MVLMNVQLGVLADGIQLPGFQGVMDMFNTFINSSLISNYIFWTLAIGLVGFLSYVLLKTFRGN